MTAQVNKEVLAGGVVRLTLSRPKAHNAFNDHLLLLLAEQLRVLAGDDSVRCVVVTGGLKSFCAGGDLAEMSAATPVQLWASPRHEYWNEIHSFPKPLIAAVNGPAFGGGFELALASDIIVAGDNARFALPEIKLGFIPGRGGTQRLPALVTKSAAMHMILTGDEIDAQTAFRLGIAWMVTTPRECVDEATRIAQRIASRPTVAVQIAKEVVSQAAAPALKSGMSTERHCYEFLVGTDDAQEGMRAFLEKRKPKFVGS